MKTIETKKKKTKKFFFQKIEPSPKAKKCSLSTLNQDNHFFPLKKNYLHSHKQGLKIKLRESGKWKTKMEFHKHWCNSFEMNPNRKLNQIHA